MKNRILRTLPFICLLILLGSCEMQKRLYRNGYHVQSKSITRLKAESNRAPVSAIELNTKESLLVTKKVDPEPLLASTCNEKINSSPINQAPAPTTVSNTATILASLQYSTNRKRMLLGTWNEPFPIRNSFPKNEQQFISKKNFNTKRQLHNNTSSVPLWAYIVLAILIGPLSIYLYEGITNRFWIDTIFYGLGIGLITSFRLAGLAALAAAVLALLVVLDAI